MLAQGTGKLADTDRLCLRCCRSVTGQDARQTMRPEVNDLHAPNRMADSAFSTHSRQGTLGERQSSPSPVPGGPAYSCNPGPGGRDAGTCECRPDGDRKSTRLNSSHLGISYAVF